MKKNKIKYIFCWVLVILWMLVIFMFSNMNSTLSNNGSKGIIKNIAEKIVEIFNINITKEDIKNFVIMANYPARKIMHFSIYFILALLLLNVFKNKNNKFKYLITIIICILYAISDEFHQTYISGRTGQILDIFIDTMGSLLAMIIFYIVNLRKNRKKC